MATIRAFSRNIPYLKQQFSALLGNTTKAVKFICIVTVCGYIVSYFDSAVTILSVTPGYLLPPSFWIWTAFTFCFLELHFWEVLVDIITVGLCGKLIEPLWGPMEMMTFFAITNFGVAVLTSFYYLFVYMCTKNIEILFNVHIHGLAGYVAAVSVAVRQIMPDHLIVRTPFGKFTNRNIPLTVLFASLILWICRLLDGTYPAMFCSGLIVSWIYLRFFQRHQNGSRGASADNFCFASFFPNVLQPFVNAIVNPVYLCCVKIGVIRELTPPKSTSLALNSVSISMPSVDPHDMERRRQIALKALSERLSKSTDSSRQNLLPKSFPQSAMHQHASTSSSSSSSVSMMHHPTEIHHHHIQHHHHSDKNQPSSLPQESFNKKLNTTSNTNNNTTSTSENVSNLIDIETAGPRVPSLP